jgi:hypothetical protein
MGELRESCGKADKVGVSTAGSFIYVALFFRPRIRRGDYYGWVGAIALSNWKLLRPQIGSFVHPGSQIICIKKPCLNYTTLIDHYRAKSGYDI